MGVSKNQGPQSGPQIVPEIVGLAHYKDTHKSGALIYGNSRIEAPTSKTKGTGQIYRTLSWL